MSKHINQQSRDKSAGILISKPDMVYDGVHTVRIETGHRRKIVQFISCPCQILLLTRGGLQTKHTVLSDDAPEIIHQLNAPRT